MKFSKLADVESASRAVYRAMSPTPQYPWPLLAERAGCEVWVKHENHTPIGAFKLRGGLAYMDYLTRVEPHSRRVIAATRGNHGQSVAFAARRHGLAATVVVPEGNSHEKNNAMRAFGAELIVHGGDFQEALEYARNLAQEKGLHLVPPFDVALVRGVVTYALELFKAVPNVDAFFVPVGQGSGICSAIAARDALGLSTQVIGVVAAAFPSYKVSFEAGTAISTQPAHTIADGVACRVPTEEALDAILRGAERFVSVTDEEIRSAMSAYYSDTHNVVEGAGAAPLAALLKEKERWKGRRVGLVASGGNVDRDVFREVLRASAT